MAASLRSLVKPRPAAGPPTLPRSCALRATDRGPLPLPLRGRGVTGIFVTVHSIGRSGCRRDPRADAVADDRIAARHTARLNSWWRVCSVCGLRQGPLRGRAAASPQGSSLTKAAERELQSDQGFQAAPAFGACWPKGESVHRDQFR